MRKSFLLLPLLASTSPAASPLAGSPFAGAVRDGGMEKRITPVVRVIESARPAVVSITTILQQPRQTSNFWLQLSSRQPNQTAGSGVVIFDDGYVMTNYHVVRNAQEIRVHFDETDDRNTYKAHLVSQVPEEDLALLKIESDGPFPTIPLCATDPILGETVIAIGNSVGQSHTVSTGIVSGLNREVEIQGTSFTGLVQTDASINRGNSGGPLLNIEGELIGINSAMNTAAENIGFAISVSRVRTILNEQLLSTSNQRSFLGFDLDEETLRVTKVHRGGPADRAGLQVGDRLVEVDGKPVEDKETWQLASLQVLPGEEIDLQVDRADGTVGLRLGTWSAADGHLLTRLGLTVDAFVLGRNAERLVEVRYVEPGGPADRLGLEAGDLLELAQAPGRSAVRLGSPERLAHLVRNLDPGTELDLELWRDDDEDGILERYPNGYSELYRGQIEVR